MQPMNRMRVGITADALNASGVPMFGTDALRLLDDPAIEWEYMEPGSADLDPRQAARYDAICAMGLKVTASSLSASDRRLKLIARLGVGYDSIDVPACSQAGVLLTIAPDGVRRPVATSALTFVLMLAQKVLVKDRLTRAGRWREKSGHIGTGLTGRTLGSIGIGNIGAELFRLARPLQMRLIAHDPAADAAVLAETGATLVDLETLFRESDFLAVNCPLNQQTRGLVSERLIGLMKPTAYLINTARGGIIDEVALTDALTSRSIAGAALDCFQVEPLTAPPVFSQFDNVLLAPHCIAWTDELFRDIGRAACQGMIDLSSGKRPRGVVNPEVLDRPGFVEKWERLSSG